MTLKTNTGKYLTSYKNGPTLKSQPIKLQGRRLSLNYLEESTNQISHIGLKSVPKRFVSGEGLAPIVSAYSRLILVDGTVL